ncbi:hypothetical protein [Natronorubrum daqingense]|uniref:Uncharacterized protein n=1 Tax=Natronorubrum daqingense TaxID=588898 RepID=A0A1N7G592_9EURY|nr:hypothetical protein [Natronorubrum daqingense]APX98718.1 hypothetical protein BB347_18605 [Natronorubrum daqingense]SIS07777.1 hypothetical protein SAMN05421809_3740 [Natronorubrum daqingense]
MTDSARSGNEDNQFSSYHAEYCENCGQLVDANEEIANELEEPVHRVDIIEAIGPFEEVGETVALEQGTCECSGQIVKRHYAYPAGNVPEPDVETPEPDDEDAYQGRHPDDDALFAPTDEPQPDDFQEVREIPGLKGRDSE